jgi:ferredoxin-thioredoxin reductase catalytic subunit
MYLMQVSEEQVNKMYRFLDETLKKDGIKSLTDVVEIYNALASAVKLQEKEMAELPEGGTEKPNEG